MCQALPGPRCAPHARNRVYKYQEQVSVLEGKLSKQMDEYQLNDNSSPENQKVKAEMDRLNAQYHETYIKMTLAQRDYYGTPTGQRELANRLEHSSSERERSRIRQEMQRAKLIRSWRKSALERKKAGLPVNYEDLSLLGTQRAVAA